MALSNRDIGRIESRMKGVRYQIDSHDRNAIACALRVASDQYRADAKANVGTSLEAEFTRQADECDVLVWCLEP